MKEEIKSQDNLFNKRKFNGVEWLTDTSSLREDSINLLDRSTLFLLRERLELPCGSMVSIQHSEGHYCDVRSWFGNENDVMGLDYLEHYNKQITKKSPEDITVELGFPNFEDERLREYAEDPDNPMDTVYAYVPITLVEEIINDKLNDYYGEQNEVKS